MSAAGSCARIPSSSSRMFSLSLNVGMTTSASCNSAHLPGLPRLRGPPDCGSSYHRAPGGGKQKIGVVRVPEWTADRDDVSTLHDRMAHLCPVCRSAAAHVRYRLPRYSIFRCAACTQVYLWPL